MAELVLSSAFQVIFDKLASFGQQKLGTILDIKVDVEKLKSKLLLVEAVLEDAEEKQVTQRAVGTWLSNLKNIVYDAEALLLRIPANISMKDSIYADEIKGMLHELEKAADEGLGFSLRLRTDTVNGECLWERPQTFGNLSYFGNNGLITKESDSSVIESEVYGREEDKKKMVELLLSCEATHGGGGAVSCITIVGLGGQGKTTLAKLAYNDQKVTKNFDVKVWVSVYHHFDVKKLLITIIESITEAKWELSTIDVAYLKVRKLLHNKRYLIVLDNVWTKDQEDWDRLRQVLFGTGIDGSKILITSQSRKVDDALGMTGFPTVRYDLGELSEEACWSLFKHRAFQRGEEEKHPILLPIGEQIVRKCGGLALAVKTLGSLMHFKREFKEWVFVRDSELWSLDECGSGILPALRLSYSRLPLHLKRCLAFCSIFPRSYEFNKEKLIHYWMAHGLIQSSSGNIGKLSVVRPISLHRSRKTLEDFGNEYFIDLEWMSFFQEIKQYENGIVTRYKMHDIIYDLLQSVNSSEYTILGHGLESPTSFRRIRHSSVVCDFRSSKILEELYEAGHQLRTLLLFSGGNLEVLPDQFYSSFPYLFVLNLGGSGLMELKVPIGSLSHLTYLDLSHTRVKSLPPQIEDLQSLQTLNLFNCYNLLELPDLRKMKSLRHLNNEGCRKLTRMLDSGRDAVTFDFNSIQLQTLPLFVVGGDLDVLFLARLRVRGSLKVTHLENIFNVQNYGFSFSFGIESLGLYWGSDDGCPNINPEGEYFESCFQERKQTELSRLSQGIQRGHSYAEDVLQKFQPPRDLKRLLIKGYSGSKFPSWCAFHLKVIDLINCNQSENLPILGNLPFLTSLSLREMHGIRCIGKEFYCKGYTRPFPVLEELILVDFPNLKEWLSPSTGGNAFPNLRKLVVNKCPKLSTMPQILSLHHLDLRDCCSTLLDSFQNLRSLETLIIERVKDLLCFSRTFSISNLCLTTWEIKSCPLLSSLPNDLGNLTALKSLVIRCCEGLDSLPQSLQYLSALESLEIGDCQSLMSIPEDGNRGLSNLRFLSIENCNSLDSLAMGFQYLTSLEIMTVMFCPIFALPQSVKHLSALRSLSILYCENLMCLPEELQDLTELQSLEIGKCDQLEVLPEWIGNLVSLRSLVISDCKNITFLPEGVECLTCLQHLSIQDCPELQQRCRPQIGEDWPKIAHVPYKHIESPNLKRPREEGSSSSNYKHKPGTPLVC